MTDVRSAKRWVTEGAVIVASILLAFGIDAAWEDRQEQVAADELARGVIQDLEMSLDDLNNVRAFHALKLDASLTAREVLRSGVPTISMDSLNVLLVRSGATQRLTPVTGAYDQLVSTGLLRLLDTDVRSAIAAWSQHQEYVRVYFERDLLDFRQNVGFPFWTRSEVAFDEMLDGYIGLSFGAPRFPHDWRTLHESHELNDVLSVFAALTKAAVDQYNELERVTVALMDLLRSRYGE